MLLMSSIDRSDFQRGNWVVAKWDSTLGELQNHLQGFLRHTENCHTQKQDNELESLSGEIMSK